ncbi:hypothetical protein ACVWXM_006237 [Bradyrhizobium sp. GM7.3]
MRLLKCLRNAAEPNNLISELFDGSTERKIQIARATLTTNFCLHEAGHAMMAELYQLPIESVNLPRLDAFLSRKRPTESQSELTPAVSVPLAESRSAVPYLLGGLFGELNIYDDDALADPEILQVFPYGCVGDFTQLRDRVAADPNATADHQATAANLTSAIAASFDGAERKIFLHQFHFLDLSEFKQFRQHRARHRSIAAQLYQRWRGIGQL